MKHIQSSRQKGFFDEQNRLEKLTTQRDPLEALKRHIPFEIFRSDLERYFSHGKDYSKGGRPSFDYILMLKILVLQRYYSLSDDAMEFALLDRLSFMRFLGLGLNDKVPDAKTIWNYRNQLAEGNMVEKLFKKLDAKLHRNGVIIKGGKMIDASIVETPIQRNSRDENDLLKDGKIPKDWKENPNKLRQKDTDAKWVSHNGKDQFGYKNHVKADKKSKLITGYSVTHAAVHDSQQIEQLLDEKRDHHQCLYADSAYRSVDIQKLLRRKNITSRIHEKGYRNKPLTQDQMIRNKRKSKVRARVEHIFGFMTNTMKAMYIRCRNLRRATATIGLSNLTYNIFRIIQLKVRLQT
jgi:IS5 family transposase